MQVREYHDPLKVIHELLLNMRLGVLLWKYNSAYFSVIKRVERKRQIMLSSNRVEPRVNKLKRLCVNDIYMETFFNLVRSFYRVGFLLHNMFD